MNAECSDIMRQCTQVGMEIHFPNPKYKQFDDMPPYADYKAWTDSFYDTHYIKYWHSRKNQGFGHYLMLNKERSFWAWGQMYLPCSPAEVIDRWTILGIKVDHAKNPDMRMRLIMEQQALYEAIISNPSASKMFATQLKQDLRAVNKEIWKHEDKVRQLMAENKDISEVAPEIHRLNDKRSAIKFEMNFKEQEMFLETKIYKQDS